MFLSKSVCRGVKKKKKKVPQNVIQVVPSRIETLNSMPTTPPNIKSSPARSRSARSALDDKAKAAAIYRSKKFFEQGHIGRSARTLANIAPVGSLADPGVRKEMTDKHPHHELTNEVLTCMANSELAEIDEMSPFSFKKLLQRMDNGSAAGYDGWTVSLLKQLQKDEEYLALHVKLVTEVANGRIMAPLAKMIQRGKLVALHKQAGRVDSDGTKHPASHRPIMMSTIVYRLAARMVSDSVVTAAAQHLSPEQLGVATPGALEAVIHNLRQALTTNDELAALLLDIRNAFNEINRSHMIQTVMTVEWLKPIRAFVKMAYGSPTPILMPDHDGKYSVENDMWSSQGVRQGDPLASLLFACAFQCALRYVHSLNPSSNVTAYLDDTGIVATPDVLITLIEPIKKYLADIGLELQTSKSCLVDFHWSERPQQLREQFETTGIHVETDCAVILGCPVGKTPEHESHFMEGKLREQLQVLDVLSDPRVSMHHATTIMRVSTVHKLDHWLRNVEPEVMRPVAAEFDDKVRKCYLNKLNLNQQRAFMQREGREQDVNDLLWQILSA